MMFRALSKRPRGGFTLIEVMIAILIIGILLAIAVPGFGRARDTARTKTCLSNLNKIFGAKEQYAMEHNLANGDPVTMDILYPEYLKVEPHCPAGGTYDPCPIGESVDCTIEGHEL